MKILVINGPNLNLLGLREPDVYGCLSLAQINAELTLVAKQAGINLETKQSNHEGTIVEYIQSSLDDAVDFIIINPAAYTHTSIAIRDALAAVNLPFIEVHVSNIYAREAFRHHSYLSALAQGVICGLGSYGYQAALNYAINYLSKRIQ